MGVLQVERLLAILTLAAEGFVVVVVALALLGTLHDGPRRAIRGVRSTIAPWATELALVVAMVAMGGSLYLSEVAHLVPCELCWYQRIAMYPTALLLARAAVGRDVALARSVRVLAMPGAAISIYHYQLERFPEQASAVCSSLAPCSATLMWQFHHVSIPWMALVAFATIVTVLTLAGGQHRRVEEEMHGQAVAP